MHSVNYMHIVYNIQLTIGYQCWKLICILQGLIMASMNLIKVLDDFVTLCTLN